MRTFSRKSWTPPASAERPLVHRTNVGGHGPVLDLEDVEHAQHLIQVASGGVAHPVVLEHVVRRRDDPLLPEVLVEIVDVVPAP